VSAKGKRWVMQGSITDRVVAHLREFGPGTSTEIAEDIGEAARNVATTICRNVGRLFRIKEWKRSATFHMHAVYALITNSVRDNAPKPPRLNSTERSRRYRAKKTVRVASVFDLGIAVRQRRLGVA
jgi:hypothetical protein